MLSYLRPHSLRLRAVWIALVLLALVWQPAVLAASAAHEAAHVWAADPLHAAGAVHLDAHVDHSHADYSHGDESHGEDSHGDPLSLDAGGDPWHQLLHQDHCCGAPSLLAGFDLSRRAAVLAESPPPLPVLKAKGPPQAQPLRPPIRG
jgi:hypothetical protein